MADQETEDKELETVQTVNVGALSAWHQFGHKEDYKQLVPVVTDIVGHMRENLALFIISREVHEFYTKNKTLTRRTILKDLSEEKANRIYSDPLYGMGNWKTLREWLIPAAEKMSKDHPSYRKLADYFGLSDKEMFSLYSSHSILKMLLNLGRGNPLALTSRNSKRKTQLQGR